jgi:hypothetical protein
LEDDDALHHACLTADVLEAFRRKGAGGAATWALLLLLLTLCLTVYSCSSMEPGGHAGGPLNRFVDHTILKVSDRGIRGERWLVSSVDGIMSRALHSNAHHKTLLTSQLLRCDKPAEL